VRVMSPLGEGSIPIVCQLVWGFVLHLLFDFCF
jgi:hypothetical protein